MASGPDPRPEGGVRSSLWAGLTSGAFVTAVAQLFQDPCKTIIQGLAGIVGPLVMGAWPTVRRWSSGRYRRHLANRSIKELRRLVHDSELAKSSEEHLEELRGRLERAELYLADLYLQEGLVEEEDQEATTAP